MSWMAAITRHRAISEVAKLMLKYSPIEIVVPNDISRHSIDDMYKQMLVVQDMTPSFVMSYREAKGEISGIEIRYAGRAIACIGKDEPKESDRIWIPIEFEKFFQEVSRLIVQFSEAGYPGCEGCLGEELNVPWNEEESRASMHQYI